MTNTLIPTIEQFEGEFAFLSNFYPLKFDWEGITWKTNEHAYQAAKTKNHEERLVIAALKTPGKAKAAGRKVTIRTNWDIVKFDVMESILRAKFDQHPKFKQMLFACPMCK